MPLRAATLATDDIAFFAPRLRDWHLIFRDADLTVAGVVADFEASIRSLRIGDGTTLTAQATVAGLPRSAARASTWRSPELRTSAAAAGDLTRRIARRELPESLAGILDNAGDIGLNARFKGTLSSFDMQFKSTMQQGN